MATNKNKEVIGYDPLAWLGLEADETGDSEGQSPIPEIQDHGHLLAESEIVQVQKLAQIILENEAITNVDGVLDGIDVEGKPQETYAETLVSSDSQWEENNSVLPEDSTTETVHVANDCMDAGDRTMPGAIVENECLSDLDAMTGMEETEVCYGDENTDLESTMTEQELSPMVDLEASMTIQHVGELHEKLKLCLARYDEIEINASDVSAIDTASLQLLVALKKDAANLQKQVSIIYPSPRFVESAQLLGLLEILEVTA